IRAGAAPGTSGGNHAGQNPRVPGGNLPAEPWDRIWKPGIRVPVIPALDAANFFMEGASERRKIKKPLFPKRGKFCPPQTLLTTNTSSISITAIAAEVKNPERVAGLHFFNPAPVMKLVEVVSGLATAAEVVEQLCELTLSWGKQPVRCHSTPGFIVNRVARPYYSEAWRALEEQVAAPEVIDAALRDGAGFPMGPLELTDLIGQDVNFAVTCSVFNAFWQERRFLPSLVQQELVIGGRLGKKSGLGVYDWRAEREAVVGLEAVSDSFSPMKVEKKSDGVTEIDDVLLIETQGETAQALAIRLARPVVVVDKMAGKVVTIAAAAVNPDSATRKAIYYLQQQGKTVLQIADYPGMLIWRTVAMIINEALDALQKGVASEQDIDTAMRLGVNYPYGPLAWGAQLGWQRILRLLENLQHHYGEERYRPCSLLRQRALLESGYES
ncbi:3-hydroxyacyl-CoA dehydrogenase PaaH, partial [Escherichia coli]|uniref:3-hydroxyacyl-CoA dehydrogenase PaaH n=1 Tax=Escherichia coli TaxID=562 RepID=UPI000CDAF540